MPPPRKRGAQPGNTNALRHGFYSRYFREQELADLDAFDTKAFESEIAMLRTSTRRVLALGDGIDDLDKAMTLLRTLGEAAQRVANMIYKSYLVAGNQDSNLAQALSNALDNISKEVDVY